jgi:hypothetical protein
VYDGVALKTTENEQWWKGCPKVYDGVALKTTENEQW